MARYRYELHAGAVHEFIDASIEGPSLVIVEGKIGTNGRRRVKACNSKAAAEMALMILVSGRLRREGWSAVKVKKAKAPQREPAPVRPRTTLDWPAIERKLVAAGKTQITKFARAHADESFDRASFVVEVYDGPFVNLALGKHYVQVSKHVAGWTKIADAIVEHTDADADNDATSRDGHWKTSTAMLDTVCRVALRLEPTFAKLERTPGFVLAVSASADEPDDMALARLAKFRKRRR